MLDISNALDDFTHVALLANATIRREDIKIEIQRKPHRSPQLPNGMMAVYAFFFGEQALKVGKVGANNGPRYSYQHYRPQSAVSTLAGFAIAKSDSYWIDADGAKQCWQMNI